MRHVIATLTILAAAGITLPRAAEPDTPVDTPTPEERVEVTATKYPDDPDKIPQSMTVVSGKDLRDRGAVDLRSALAMVAGVDVAPGGDGGPASAVPEMWGFREFDAYLLLVDGVPWGGAFNPQVSTLSLVDVDRIEILRGAAPVMYGATSFIGVIHVIHAHPGQGQKGVGAAVGSHGSVAVGASFDLPDWAGFQSRLTVDGENREYPDDRTSFLRGHLNWRNLRSLSGGGNVFFNLDGVYLDQEPASPVPRVGAQLAQNVPLDTNYNPSDSKLDPRRAAVSGGFSLPKSYGVWSGILSYAHTSDSAIRGFVTDTTVTPFPVTGSNSETKLDEIYLDAHVEFTKIKKTQVLVGVDYLYGRGQVQGGEINYTIAPDGSNPPDGAAIAPDTDANIEDTRNFGGLYGYAAWTPAARWRLEGGLRLNLTDESRDTAVTDFPAGTFESGSDSVSETRLGGSAGVTFTAWSRGVDDVRIYGDYRNAYKPAAMDFGLEAEEEILDPETSESFEVGVRSALMNRKLEMELSAFDMELHNLVVATQIGGQPVLENVGAMRFRGVELEVQSRLPHDLVVRAAGSYHDAKFLDYQQDFGGVLTQLEGNRQEMTPIWLAGAGVIYAPPKGFIAHIDGAFTGSRYLNKRNTALAPQFSNWGMGVGWRGDRWEVRVDGTNLNDRRDPVSESELGDASYYLLEARRVWVSFNWRF